MFFLDEIDLSGRTEIVSTYFLSGAAMLYVVGESLPKTDFLTCIDQVIVLTMATLAAVGVFSCAIFLVASAHGEEAAAWWNKFLAATVAVAYCAGNMIFLLRPWMHKISAVKQLSRSKPSKKRNLHRDASSLKSTV